VDVSVCTFEELSIAKYAQVGTQAHKLNHCIGVLVLSELKIASLSIFRTYFVQLLNPGFVFPALDKCIDCAHEDEIDDHNTKETLK